MSKHLDISSRCFYVGQVLGLLLFNFLFDWRDVGELHGLEGTGIAFNLFVGKRNKTIRKREKRVVRTHFHVLASSNLRAALAHDNAADFGKFTSVELGAEALTLRIAAVTCRTTGFFVSHNEGILVSRSYLFWG